jgi:N-succinyldiaminopimelate aminotransferase
MEGTVYALHVGDTYREPLFEARAEAQLSREHSRLHNYSPVQGEPALLEAIVERALRLHGAVLDPSRLQVTLGATGGLSAVAAALLEPEDEVIVLAPYWPLIRGIVAGRGAKAVEVPFYDRCLAAGFDVGAALSAALTERTVALYMGSPNNPTGTVHSEAIQAALCSFAEAHGLWIFSDEAYEDLSFGPTPTPAWISHSERTLSCHTVSKSYGLAGARVGWVYGPETALGAVRGAQTFLTYCAPKPMQLGAARALRAGDEWVAEARAAYASAGSAAAQRLGLAPPQGGTFLFFDVSDWPSAAEGVQGFLERALDRGVLLTPGAASGAAYASWVRLCFTAVPPDELVRATERLAILMPS